MCVSPWRDGVVGKLLVCEGLADSRDVEIYPESSVFCLLSIPTPLKAAHCPESPAKPWASP